MKRELTENEKNILQIGIALLVLIVFFGINLINNYITSKKEVEVSHEVTSVTDNSRYFTVINCVQKYLTTVASGDASNILLTLNEEYKTTYQITENNLKNYIPSLDSSAIYDYVGDKMYQKKVSKNVTEYYVYGDIHKTILDESDEVTNYNLTVILYEDEMLYSIRPGVSEIET